MDLDFDGAWSIRCDLGLVLIRPDELSYAVVPDPNELVVVGGVDDQGAGNHDEVGGIARMGLLDGLLEISREEAVVPDDISGVVAPDEDVSRWVNGFQLVEGEMLQMVFEVMVIKGAFVGGWSGGRKHV